MKDITSEVSRRRRQVVTVDALLSRTYGEPEWSPGLDALSELVLTILSQHTSDLNSGAAFDKLRDRFSNDWQSVMTAPVEDVAAAIRSAGLSNTKAPRIQAVLREVLERTGSLNLDFLARMELDDAKRWLTSLKGVGPKTAACVLMFSFGLPAMPVDTHVLRVSRRLGLIEPRVNAERAHVELENLVEADRVYPFHVGLIRHGRQVCKAPVPLCDRCPLTDLCEYFQSKYSDSPLVASGWSSGCAVR